MHHLWQQLFFKLISKPSGLIEFLAALKVQAKGENVGWQKRGVLTKGTSITEHKL